MTNDTIHGKDDFSLITSHQSQAPSGLVELKVAGPTDAEFRVRWSSEPDVKLDPTEGHESIWMAPDGLGMYTVKAFVRIGEIDELEKIDGIGEAAEAHLLGRGIDIYAALAAISDDEVADIADNLTNVNEDRVRGWVAEAGKLAMTTPEKFVLSFSQRLEVASTVFQREVVESLQKGAEALKSGIGGGVKLTKQFPPATRHKALWAIIRNRSDAVSFNRYKKFVDSVMCGGTPEGSTEGLNTQFQRLRFRGTDSYELLKKATEAFLMHETGVMHEDIEFDEEEEKTRLPQLQKSNRTMAANRDLYLVTLEDESRTFPYFQVIRERLSEIPLKPPGASSEGCYGILKTRISPPVLIELIWSYWHEEGMLAQSLKTLSLRFQNRAVKGEGNNKQALSTMNLDPLRPLGNLLWGYIQDEQHRLSVARRAYEYDHHYGFSIAGRAVPQLESADSRNGFLEAFHMLLHRCSIYYREQSDTTKVPDGYPILNTLKECHLLLAQGAHNQYGDLPWTARVEMLMEMWLLARPEMREFLGRRTMVPYPEEWMPAVDQMRDLMGWRGTSIRHFQELGHFGEMILLSIRFGNWSDEFDENVAALWAQQAREAVLAYLNAYRAATGVDLSADGDKANVELSRKRTMAPSALLRSRGTATPAE